MGRLFSHRRNQSCRRGPAPDYHDLLACIVQISGPELRIDQRPLKRILLWKGRLMTFCVAVIATAQIEKPRAELTPLTGFDRLDVERPGGLFC